MTPIHGFPKRMYSFIHQLPKEICWYMKRCANSIGKCSDDKTERIYKRLNIYVCILIRSLDNRFYNSS